MEDQAQPLFRQIARFIEDAVAEGELAVGERVSSTNELARFHSVNPATARKGLAMLVELGVLERRRGIGTFVAAGARERVLARRGRDFAQQYLAPTVDEAVRLGMSREELHGLLDRVAESRGLYR
ncbi:MULTISPECIES: GntR family transcriptional regulator [Corynebacterium]|uniref:GntR family transcriptional regulator n=1 Tax=Corynebacterium TaxID=1716 RepID=UPI00254BCEB6|nr:MULTISPECIES: GntR family transcriptional regulator [Corynebacterium]MDK6260928.1 GntR family transcriptional regulator [Corynebacterium frankenforstense]MDK8895369.1 GntR family transcriptional regulator [Corynebacterium sp. MSK006]